MKIKFKVEKEINFFYDKLRKISVGLANLSETIHPRLMYMGEKLSVDIMSEIFYSFGYPTTVVNPIKFLLSDCTNYLDVKINLDKSINQFSSLKISQDHIILMAGFVAVNNKKEIVTLGRNGSDYSASVLSVCLRADICEIWKDVNGIYSCDPNIVKCSHLIKRISYKDAILLSKFGANVLHHRAVYPIRKFNIPCVIKNTFSPHSTGTLISNVSKNINCLMEVKGITSIKNIVVVVIYSDNKKIIEKIKCRIFNKFFEFKILIITSKNLRNLKKQELHLYFHKKKSVCYILKRNFMFDKKENEIKSFTIVEKLSIISIIGGLNISYEENLKNLSNFLSSYDIKIYLVLTDRFDPVMSIVVQDDLANDTLRLCHQFFFKKEE
ncbi:aspartate kinase [Candidatus Riesia pediculischaeffi]|uniref:aspartate kinase n=1 Tax=Candidatus Riesia pediculischaeffi TaxID=428411 RepID=UPI000584D6B4|nr:aspartate kinase [Candidatus Riesia pediculischaeffi]